MGLVLRIGFLDPTGSGACGETGADIPAVSNGIFPDLARFRARGFVRDYRIWVARMTVMCEIPTLVDLFRRLRSTIPMSQSHPARHGVSPLA